jgi:hypothetical protein
MFALVLPILSRGYWRGGMMMRWRTICALNVLGVCMVLPGSALAAEKSHLEKIPKRQHPLVLEAFAFCFSMKAFRMRQSSFGKRKVFFRSTGSYF